MPEKDKCGHFVDGNGQHEGMTNKCFGKPSQFEKTEHAQQVFESDIGKLPDNGITSIKQQIQANLEKIKNTKILATIGSDEIVTNRRVAIDQLREKLNADGGIVKRDGLGEVDVLKKLTSAASYLKSSAEIAALNAVPEVIKGGIEISRHNDHKGRDYPTYTFAGRVNIGAHEGYMAVVVMKTSKNRYKTHRILTPDGNALFIE